MLEQEIIIQRDTGIRSAAELYAVQLEDIADQIEAVGHREEAEALREDAQTIREAATNYDHLDDTEELYQTAEELLTEITGHYAVTIPENGAWLIVTEAGLALLDEA